MSSAITLLCKICKNNVTNYDQTIQCDLCDSWVHIKCNDLNYIDCQFLQQFFRFSTVKNKNFISSFYDSNKSKNIVDKDSSLLLKPSEHLKHQVNQFNNMSSQPDDINSGDPANIVSSKCYNNIDELQNLKIRNNNNSLSFI